jgi:LysM repeat protein
MQRIERYGVIALVFLLVTILAVSLWGEGKGDGWFSKLTGGTKSPENTAAADRLARRNANRAAQLAQNGEQGVPADALAAEKQLGGPNAGATPMSQLNTGVQGSLQGAPQGSQGANPALLTPNSLAAKGAVPPLGQTPNGAMVTPISQTGGAPVVRGLNDKPLGGAAQINPLTGQPNALTAQPPAQSASREYKVKSGDTLGAIAQHELGSAKRASDIQRLNNNIDPAKLMPGMTLVLPGDAKVAVASAPTPSKTIEPKTTSEAKAVSGGRKYTVRSGDTLSVIASRELGSAKRWTEIRDLNPGVDEKGLKVNTVLAMPGGAAMPATERKSESKTESVASLSPATSSRKSKVQ